MFWHLICRHYFLSPFAAMRDIMDVCLCEVMRWPEWLGKFGHFGLDPPIWISLFHLLMDFNLQSKSNPNSDFQSHFGNKLILFTCHFLILRLLIPINYCSAYFYNINHRVYSTQKKNHRAYSTSIESH